MSKNKKSKFRSFLGKRQFRYGWYATLITVLVIAVVVVVNMAAGAIEDRFALSIDMSSNSITSLSDQTLEVLGQVDEEVHIYTVYQNSLRPKAGFSWRPLSTGIAPETATSRPKTLIR